MIMYWPDTPHHLHLSAGRIIMTFFVRMTLILLIVAGLLSEQVDCYSLLQRRNSCSSRREALSQVCKRAYPILAGVVPFIPNVVHAKEAPEVSQDISMVTEATDALSVLVENWERATVDCTYADVPRELLEAKNKEKLLEKASEFALFDKSTSVVSCKRTNRVVRDYIGATGKGPLVNLEKRLLKKSVVELVDPDSLDDYIAGVYVCLANIVVLLSRRQFTFIYSTHLSCRNFFTRNGQGKLSFIHSRSVGL
jgi:hypothetical protein